MNDCDDWYAWMDTCLRWQYDDVNQRAMMRDGQLQEKQNDRIQESDEISI